MHQIPVDLFKEEEEEEGEGGQYEFTGDHWSNGTLAFDSRKDWTHVNSLFKEKKEIRISRSIGICFRLSRYTYISLGISRNCCTYIPIYTLYTQTACHTIYKSFKKFLTNVYTKWRTRLITRIFDYYTYWKYVGIYIYMRVETEYI